jgi:LysM repeat protein
MSVIPFILAAGSLPSLISGAPVPYLHSRDVAGATTVHSFAERSSSAYTVFGGNGQVSDGWPSIDNWLSSFDDMFEANKDVMSSSCEQWGVPSTSEQEMSDMSDSIQSVAKSTGVDARFILAIVMQESNGCVRAPTTNYGVVNPGLMQSHDGTGSCNNGAVQNPCPADQITQMIKDGTAGTSEGDGLQQLISQAGTDDVTKYYVAARMYNSGSVASGGNLGQGIATHCYVSDIANRLMGWATGPSSCDSGTIGSLTSGSGSLSSGGDGGSSATSTTSASPTIAPVTSVTPSPEPVTTTAPAPTTTASPVTTTTTTPVAPAITTSVTPAGSTATAATSSSSAPVYPQAATSCQKYYTVDSGDYCLQVEAKVGITASQLQDWNPGLDEACSNLWLGYQYCIQA